MPVGRGGPNLVGRKDLALGQRKDVTCWCRFTLWKSSQAAAGLQDMWMEAVPEDPLPWLWEISMAAVQRVEGELQHPHSVCLWGLVITSL